MPLPAATIAVLGDIVGSGALRHRAELLERDPGVDPRNLDAELMVRPATTVELARLLAYCHAQRIAVVPQGGRTGLAGGAVSRPGQIIVSLDRMDQIEALDPLSRIARVGAGVTLAALAGRAMEHGLAPGIDLGARGSATIGGMISTNAGGPAAFRHGTMRERVLGLEVVLADGTVLSELGQVRKRNEGLAVEQVFVGAEGTLGVISRATLSLVAADGPTATALVGLRDLVAGVALCDALLRDAALAMTALELMSANHAGTVCRACALHGFDSLLASPYLLLVAGSAACAAGAEAALVAQLTAAAAAGLIGDAVLAHNEAQREAMWRMREDWAVDRERPGGLWYDVSVPLAQLSDYLDAVAARLARHDGGLSLYVIGHLGDGNLHLTINAPRPINERYEEIAHVVTEDLAALGGSFSAEHGIGLEKRATLRRLGGSVKLELMRRLKATLDPLNIMNPGKVLPD
jgi:FAD/FMN-containing dehydrogenase